MPLCPRHPLKSLPLPRFARNLRISFAGTCSVRPAAIRRHHGAERPQPVSPGMLAPLKGTEVEEEPLDELADDSEDNPEEGTAKPSTPVMRGTTPSTFGLSFCLDLVETEFEAEARWGQYLQEPDADGKLVWKRYPRGGAKKVSLAEGNLPEWSPDTESPHVMVRGRIRRRTDHWSVRRQTGTQYTPRSLTESVVEHALAPVVYIGPAEGKPPEEWQLKSAAQILDLKICDLACGSAAFLVAAARYLSARLVEAWETAQREHGANVQITPYGNPSSGQPQEELIPVNPDERGLYAPHIVVERCLYGVDRNHLAVEMAKLSLWLLTLQRNRPVHVPESRYPLRRLAAGRHAAGTDRELQLLPARARREADRVLAKGIQSAFRPRPPVPPQAGVLPRPLPRGCGTETGAPQRSRGWHVPDRHHVRPPGRCRHRDRHGQTARGGRELLPEARGTLAGAHEDVPLR
jgi:hypothetical protein